MPATEIPAKPEPEQIEVTISGKNCNLSLKMSLKGYERRQYSSAAALVADKLVLELRSIDRSIDRKRVIK